MIKKILKIVGVLFLLLIATMFAIPYFFKDQIQAKIMAAINEKVDAKVSVSDVDLSLFKNFPNATVRLNDFLIINKAPFAGDTLVSLERLNLKMSVRELFNDANAPIAIDGISSENGKINILFNKDGIGNFDIAIKDKNATENGKSKPLNLKINEYSVRNFKFQYYDERSKMRFIMDSLNHAGTGDFAKDVLDLDTKSSTNVTLIKDSTSFMKNIKISLDAVIGIDLKSSKYTFKNNKALINNLPLEFDGFIALIPAGQEYDLKFKTPTSSFQNFLGLIPAAYSASLKDVKTTGNFTVAGFAKGVFSDTTIPKFNLEIASNNASFQYPNLPKSVQNIVIDTKIINETGLMNDTYVNLNKLSFKIDQDVFEAKATVKNIAINPLVDAAVKGTINLANLSQAYPVKLDKNLSGILNADVTTSFDINAVKTNQYQNIKNAGTMRLSGFKYVDEKGKALNISTAAFAFNPSRVNLQEFKATTGKTDLSMTGTLDNFYGFLFSKQELKGNFDMKSNQFAVSDFMTTETAAPSESKTAAKKEAIKIPAFLNCAITATANTVLYDNLVLKNASGRMLVNDQKVTLQNMKTSIFEGLITMNGSVSTKSAIPVFDMSLVLNKVDISQTFTQLEMLKKIAPIAGIINGKLNSTINLSGKLDAKEMTPDISSITGDLLGQMLSTTINSKNSTVVNALTNNLKFLDMSKINLNDVKAILTFDKGRVNVKPFDIKYQDIKINVGGSHGFDQSMAYNLKLDVPAKYLGSEANALLAKLSPADAAKLQNVPINAILSGNFGAPKISTDMKTAVTALATQLVQQQKTKLINQGTTALGNLLGGNKKDTANTKANQQKEDIKKSAGDLINGLFGKKK
ncbi:MAG: hypothetical protein RLZZ312_1553 [Bacteroidota bacterium]